MKSNAFTGTLLIITAAVLWGLDGVFLTPKLFNLDVRFIVLMLHLIPFSFFSVILHKQFIKASGFHLKDWSLFLAVALTGGVIGTLAIVKALMLIHFQPLSVVVLLQKLQPVFAVILAMLILGEKPGLRFFLLGSITVTASYFLTFGLQLPDIQNGRSTIEAALYALIAAAAFGSATTLGKKVLLKHDARTALFYRYGLTSVIMLAVVLISGKLAGQIRAATPLNWIVFAVTAATTGSGAIFIYYTGMKKVSASVATLCELFFPISAIVFDLLFNKAHFSPVQLVSAGVMSVCIILIGLDNSRREALNCRKAQEYPETAALH